MIRFTIARHEAATPRAQECRKRARRCSHIAGVKHVRRYFVSKNSMKVQMINAVL